MTLRPVLLVGLLLSASLARGGVDFACDESGVQKTLNACAEPDSKTCLARYARVLSHCQENRSKTNDPDELEHRIVQLKSLEVHNPGLIDRSVENMRASAKSHEDVANYKAAAPMALKALGLNPETTSAGTSESDIPGVEIDPEQGDDLGTTSSNPDRRPKRDEPPASAATKSAKADLAKGDAAGAEKKLDAAIERNPNDASALSLRSQLLSEKGDREGALADARRIVELNPRDDAARALISSYEGLSHAQSKTRSAKLDFGATGDAGSLGAGKAGAAGASAGTAAAGAAPAAVFSAVPSPAAALLQEAGMRLALGDVTGTLLLLQRARDRDPANPAVEAMIAKVSNAAKNFAGAVAAANRALALDPKNAAALREKAFAEYSLGQLDLALADAERAVQLDPQNGTGFLYRAMIEERLGRAADARRDYEAAQNLDPALLPLAAEGLKRLGVVAAEGPRPSSSIPPAARRRLFEGGTIALATLLIVIGLTGTAAGRSLTRRARVALTPGRARPGLGEAARTVAAGDFLGEHYRVTRELGRGGMGVVYEAIDETLNRRVAIKQLQREGRESSEDIERFLHEARLVAQLKHPHIAEIYAVVGGGDLLLVFEYVDGQPLDRLVGGGRRLPPGQVRRVLSEIASALAYAHERRIVHRDLKPSNIMLARDGSAKVMDFGIAHQSRSGADATRTDFLSGTPPYMSPEQMSGSVSPAADVYALGVMAYEMLTGRRPFEGPDFMEQKLRRAFPPASSLEASLPPALDAFFVRALEPDPTKRIPNARAFAGEFAAALGATPSRA